MILSALVARYLSFLPFLVFSAGRFIRSPVYAARNTYAPNSFFFQVDRVFLWVALVACYSICVSLSPLSNAVNSSLLSSGYSQQGVCVSLGLR